MLSNQGSYLAKVRKLQVTGKITEQIFDLFDQSTIKLTMVEKYLVKLERFVFSHKALLAIIILTFLVRLPSLFEPLWYGDEAIYLTIGQKIARGGLMYVDIFDHKTPGIYYLAAGVISFLGETIWSFRFLLMVWVLGTLGGFYFLSKRVFDKKTAVLATALLSLLTATPLIEGNITNSEILMILPTSLGFLLALKKKFFWAGVFLSLSFLLKFTGIFDFGAFFVFLILTVERGKIRQTLRNLIILTSGWLLPILLTFLYFIANGALSSYLNSAFFYNVSYTSYGNSFLVGNGLLILKALPVFVIFSYFAVKAFINFRRVGKTGFGIFDFLIIWLSFSFYAAVFGGRPYEHYLIHVVAPFSLIAAATFFNKAFVKVGLGFLVVTFVLTFYLGFRPYISSTYYPSFFNYLFGRITFDQYADSFNPQTSINYALSTFVKGCQEYNAAGECVGVRNLEGGDLYVFANQPAIYFLSGLDPSSKYITFFHIAGRNEAKSETINSIQTNRPNFILAENPRPGEFTDLENILHSDYNLFASYENFDIFRHKQTEK